MTKKTFCSLMFLFCLTVFSQTETAYSSNVEQRNTDESVKRASDLFKSGNALKAYRLLVPLEPELAGRADFDYLLGLAALESGNPTVATLAFERLLLIQPNFAGVRIDLGRAYFEMGSYTRSRTEFNTVLKMNPPPMAKKVAENYLVAIEEMLSATKTNFTGFVETIFGYDTNANNSTDNSIIYVPALSLNLTLSPTNVETDDSYAGISAGVSIKHKFTDNFYSYLGTSGIKRMLSKEKELETDRVSARTGIGFGNNINTIRMGMNGTQLRLDNRINSKLTGGNLEWQHTFSRKNRSVFFGQGTSIRYPDVKINNTDQYLAGWSLLHSMKKLWHATFTATGYGGYNFEKENRADGSNAIYALRSGFQIQPNQKFSVFMGLGEQYSGYKQENPAFLETREDLQFDARLSITWQPLHHLTIRPAVNFLKNDSNIAMYDYDRTDVFMTVRYDFN